MCEKNMCMEADFAAKLPTHIFWSFHPKIQAWFCLGKEACEVEHRLYRAIAGASSVPSTVTGAVATEILTSR